MVECGGKSTVNPIGKVHHEQRLLEIRIPAQHTPNMTASGASSTALSYIVTIIKHVRKSQHTVRTDRQGAFQAAKVAISRGGSLHSGSWLHASTLRSEVNGQKMDRKSPEWFTNERPIRVETQKDQLASKGTKAGPES